MDHKISDVISLIEKSDSEKVIEAFRFARSAHRGQKRANGKLYITHPIEVSYILARWKQDPDVISAGLLHDVVEDCRVDLKTLRKKFGERTAMLVDGASWIEIKKGGEMIKDWPATYQKFADCCRKDHAMVILKAADMIHNRDTVKIPSKMKSIGAGSGPRNKSFWIPFFREAGLTKLAGWLDKDLERFEIKKTPISLRDHISKRDMASIRKKLAGIEEIRKLRE